MTSDLQAAVTHLNDEIASLNERLQSEIARRQEVEARYNATLAALRKIDSELPRELQLSGSPSLTDSMAYVAARAKALLRPKEAIVTEGSEAE